jgi:hypothetical protein
MTLLSLSHLAEGFGPGVVAMAHDEDAFPTTDASVAMLDPYDAQLLESYDPATSLAWPGAVPMAVQGDLFDALAPLDAATDAAERAFRKEGFVVAPICGVGSRRVVEGFLSAHHYLGSAGMAGGIAFGLYAPNGTLVGVAAFARPTNPKTAAGMFPRDTTDREARGLWALHLDVAESEALDFVRLSILDATSGFSLGCGAETFFMRTCLKFITARNRARWRAIRAAEIGLVPLDPIYGRLPFVKIIRTFADPRAGHSGQIYRTASFFAAGSSRAEAGWIGDRSRRPLSGRQRTKLRNAGQHGHVANVLRAAWEGGVCRAEAFDAQGVSLAVFTLEAMQQAADATPRTLTRVWRALASATAPSATTWTLTYLSGGFSPIACPAKPRFLLFLGAPPVARALARRCRYLRAALLQADRDWSSPTRRWSRGIGFNWRQQPDGVQLLAWAQQQRTVA